MPSFSNTLRALDNYVFDYVPGLTLITASVALGFKCYFRYILSGTEEKIRETIKEKKIFNNNYFAHVYSKSSKRYAVSLIPIIGNVGLACSDLYDKYTGAKLFKKAETHSSDADKTVYWSCLHLAAKKGHILACARFAIEAPENTLGMNQAERIRYLRQAAAAGETSAQQHLEKLVENKRALEEKDVKRGPEAPDRGLSFEVVIEIVSKQDVAQDPDAPASEERPPSGQREEDVKRAAAEVPGQGLPAEQDEVSGSDAQYALARKYLFGEGVEQDKKRAAELLKLAADQEHVEAQCLLGTLYLEEENTKEALEYLEKAASQSFPEALYVLGQCYLQGHGVVTDKEKAIELFRLAAHNGSQPAQKILDESEKANKDFLGSAVFEVDNKDEPASLPFEVDGEEVDEEEVTDDDIEEEAPFEAQRQPSAEEAQGPVSVVRSVYLDM